MNSLFTKRLGVLISFFSFISSVSFSQLENLDILRSAPSDGAKFVQAYVTPWANAFGAGLNGGWYNTAKPHKFGGFDITTGVNVGFVPSSAETFDLSSIGLSSNVKYDAKIAPTVAGPDEDGPNVTYSSNGVELAKFNTPPGTDWKYIPVPTLQVGIGLPLGTEVKARFIPKINIEDGNISLWGVGIMHSIMQYFPGNKLLPFDVSLFAGYTSLNANVPISLDPDPSVSQAYSTYNPSTAFADQNMNVKVGSLNISAIASFNLPVITFYGGLGYSKTRTGIELSGYYPTPVLVTSATAAPKAQYNDSGVKKGEDFPNMDIENFSGLRANVGFRVKMACVTIHADYTRAQYNIVSTGLGISFR
ncbi:MAG: hypothetical protein LLG13_14515 [Bacteroidales bacterium]|nr:hypothetical protein [Bacteroidales bacterium]